MKRTEIAVVALAVVIYYVTAYLIFGYACPSRILFGMSCPGCGMSRAVAALLRLHFAEAFHYHPLFFMLPCLAYIFYRIMTGKTDLLTSALTVVTVFSFLIVFAVRVYLKSDVLVFRYQDGFIYKFFN